jgi:hypothetical protein
MSAAGASENAPPASGSSLAGKWETVFPMHGTVVVFVYEFDVKGDTFTGTGGVGDSLHIFKFAEGKINGGDISFKWVAGDRPISLVTGKLYGDQLTLLVEDAPERPNPRLGVKHSWTLFRNPGRPFAWVPDKEAPMPFPAPAIESAGTAANNGLTGRWEAPFVRGAKTGTYEFAFNASGSNLSGDAALLGDRERFKIDDGRIDGDDITFTLSQAGQAMARFTGKVYGDQLALVMESAGGKQPSDIWGGGIHALTAYRNDGETPWHTWFPTLLDKGRMGIYSTMARLVYEAYQKRDMVNAATLAAILNDVWDHSEGDLQKRSPEIHDKIDFAMDTFLIPIDRYKGGMPDPAKVERDYKDYMAKLKLAN